MTHSHAPVGLVFLLSPPLTTQPFLLKHSAKRDVDLYATLMHGQKLLSRSWRNLGNNNKDYRSALLCRKPFSYNLKSFIGNHTPYVSSTILQKN